jgi:hypothetical protein
MGVGYNTQGYRRTIKTDSDGRYEVSVPPDQVYTVYVQDARWSESEFSGFAVAANQDSIERNIRLRPVTRVHGQITDTVNQEPVPEQTIILTRRGVDWQSLAKNVLTNPGKMPLWTYPVQVVQIESDAQGQYEFLVGDGDYQLVTEQLDGLKQFSVRGDADVSIDVSVQLKKRIAFTGRVIDDITGQAVASASVTAFATNFDDRDVRSAVRSTRGISPKEWTSVSDQDGRVSLRRVNERQAVQVMSPDKTRGTMTTLASDETDTNFRLQSLGTAHARLMNSEGTAPMPNRQLIYGVRIMDENTHAITWRFGGVVTTDSKGNLHFENLVPAVEYECIGYDTPLGHSLTVAKIKIQPGQRLELGDLRIPVYKPYVAATLADQINDAFNVLGSFDERFATASKRIEIADQNLLVLFGNPDDARVRNFMATRLDSSIFKPYRDDFRVLPIATDAARLESAQSLASRFNVKLSAGREKFHVLMLDKFSNLIANIDASQLCYDDQFSREKLFDLLDRHRIAPRDAKSIFDAAIQQAARENKRVLVQETAAWCSPCHTFSQLLQSNRQWEQDYVWVQIDQRWTGARDVIDSIGGSDNNGVPWCAILDSSGKTLITSDDPQTGRNSGFPALLSGRDHFANMFRSTRIHMTDAEIDALVDAAEALSGN